MTLDYLTWAFGVRDKKKVKGLGNNSYGLRPKPQKDSQGG